MSDQLVPYVETFEKRALGWLGALRTARLTARGWWEKAAKAAKARPGGVKARRAKAQSREERETEKLMQAIARAKASGKL
jgi:hypothetical protein